MSGTVNAGAQGAVSGCTVGAGQHPLGPRSIPWGRNSPVELSRPPAQAAPHCAFSSALLCQQNLPGTCRLDSAITSRLQVGG